jgi:hypothetical protein
LRRQGGLVPLRKGDEVVEIDDPVERRVGSERVSDPR